MCLVVEINIWKIKYLLYHGTYNPHKSMISNHLFCLYDNIATLGDFNREISEDNTSEFCEIYNLKNLVKDLTCF